MPVIERRAIFRCDRCKVEASGQIDDDHPWGKLPNGWAAMRTPGFIHTDSYLCSQCSVSFNRWWVRITEITEE